MIIREALRINFKEENETFLSYIRDELNTTELADMLIEECTELVQAVCKFKRLSGRNLTSKCRAEVLTNLNEEIADVKVAAMALLYALETESTGRSKIYRWVDRLRATEDDND